MNALPTRPKWTSILALLLVPLLVAGGFLWGTWNANPRLRTVQAAVVNLDEMVEINGQLMPLGRQLAAELINSEREQNLTWVLADTAHAQKGLANGTYAAVVTIPKEFSAAATSFSKGADEAVQATIRVDTSPVTGVSETALGKHIADAASNALNRFLTGEYLKNIYLGFNQMGEQFTELKDGTRKLADGAGQLSGGVSQAANGADQLADGLGLASSGGVELRSGAHQLAGGVRQFSGGVRQYTDGVAKYGAGVKRYVGVVNPIVEQVRDLVAQVPDWGDLIAQLDPIMSALPEWAKKVDGHVQQFVSDLRAFLDKVDAYVGTGQSVSQAVNVYGAKLAGTMVSCPSDLAATPGACEAFARGVKEAKDAAATQWATVDKKADALAADGATIKEWTAKIRAAATQLSSVSKQFVAWAPTALAKWNDFKAQLPTKTLTKADVMSLLNQFIDGGNQLMSGADELTAGGTKLADGADQLAGGATKLADGVDAYTRGITKAASGARELADGMAKLDGGASELAAGVAQLADGVAEGASKIPTYTDGQRENLAKVVASPIDTTGLDELVMPTVSWASLLVIMALWLGALAAYTVFRAVDPRNVMSSASNGRLLWRSLLPGLGIVAVQAVLLAALSVGVLGLDVPRALGVTAVALVAAVTFVAVNHALAAWFGVKGRVASLALLLVTVVSAVAYSAPGVFDLLKPLSPLTPALDAIRMMMTGHSATLPALALVAWLVAGLGASYLAIVRSRTASLAALVTA